MNSFKKPTKRAALVTGVAGVALLGAIGVGGAAYADGMPTPSASGSAAAPAPQASGSVTAPAAPGASGSATAPTPTAGPGAAKGDAGPRAEQGKHEPHIGGEVQSVSGSTITVKDMDGFTRTIALGSGATVTKDGSSSSASAITKGEHIEATGSVASNGTTLNATKVEIGQPAGPGKGGPAAGGPAADGKGPQGDGGQRPTPPAAGQQGGAQQGGGSTAPAAPSAPAPQASGSATAPSAPVQGS